MSFNLETAVQQGFNRDPETNDWHVEAHDLEIQLSDAGGGNEFRILDSDEVAVVVADSDGYLAIAGNAEIYGGHILVQGEPRTNEEFITLRDIADEASIFLMDTDPNGVTQGSKGSLGLNYSDGYAYINLDGATQWERLKPVNEIDRTVTLQVAYDNDPDGGDAIIQTNATDGAIIISGTEKLQVTATGGIDLDSGFDMDSTSAFDVELTGAGFSIDSDTASNIGVAGADLDIGTTTSGDVTITVPEGTGDFNVVDASGSQYIKADTSSSELHLGDTGTPVLVKVLENLEVQGDLLVMGDTTTVNTAELYVEDRLIRLNNGTYPSFSGTTGFEAEVGNDGYVEFHWNDADGYNRWEISIDSSLVPEEETFRPLPYLAYEPATLDLSSIGTSGYPTAGPNPDAGASVINTNASNFPYTFGPDMGDNSVQAALEAIDGYLVELGGDVLRLEEIADLTHEPSGFVNRTDSEFSFTNGTRVFSIQPKAPATEYEIYLGGDKYVINTTETVTIDDTEGLWYIYFDGNRDLVASQVFDPRIITEWAFVSVIYWNADDNQAELLGEERHGIVMDGVTHSYLHNILGAQWNSGLGLANLSVDGDGSLAAHARFAVGDGAFYDEDIRHTITDGSPQDIDPIAYIPIFWKEASDGDWRKKTADTYPLIQAGSITEATGTLPSYNQWTGSAWQLTEVSNDGYFLMHYFATNDVNTPIVGIVGENEYADISSASAGITSEFNSLFTDGLPGPEFAALATVIFNANSSYSNAPKAIIVTDDEGNDYTDWRLVLTDRTGAGGTQIGDHGNLGGLSDDDHLQYLTEARHDALPYDNPHNVTFTQAVSADGGTDITAAEAETLTDGSSADLLHTHTSTSVSLSHSDLSGIGSSDHHVRYSDSEAISAVTPYIVTDHGALTGLGDDDHTQYLLANGSRSLTAPWDAAYAISTPEINYAGTLSLDGSTGIVLDGNGNNVIPQTACTDSLGDSTHGWTDLWVCVNGEPMSLVGDGYASAPNTNAGAYIVGTNPLNFVTFGPSMTDSNVQAALEAIDGYLTDIVSGTVGTPTLQEVFNESIVGGAVTLEMLSNNLIILGEDADVVVDTDGYVSLDSDQYINLVTGTGDITLDSGNDVVVNSSAFDVNTTGDTTVDSDNITLTSTTDTTISSGNDVDISATNDVNVTGVDVTIDGSGTTTIDGNTGIVLDGNGNNVIPQTACTDSLGDSTHGWTDLWVCVNGVPTSLVGDGYSSIYNSGSGASIVGTNPLNFNTFGSYMVDSTVQAALEAIDGYLATITVDLSDITLQEVINNSVDENGDIVLELGDNDLVINGGDSDFSWNTDGYFDVTVNQYINLVTETGDVTIDSGNDLDINVTGDTTIDSDNITLTSVTDTTINSGDDVTISATNDVDITGTDITIDGSGTTTIDGDTGIVLDGNGNNVIPQTACTDSLGDSTHGWTDLFVCVNGVPTSLVGDGYASASNTGSGAAIVGTNPLNFETFGPDMTDSTVQGALEAIDGYLKDLTLDSLDSTYYKTVGLDINGAVLNGVVKVSTDAGTPALDYGNNRTSRASWSIPVPSDWDGSSDIEIRVVWSASGAQSGNVEWRLEYKSLALSDLASAAASTDDYLQAASGTADEIQSTSGNLVIPGSAISETDEIIVINVVRRGQAGTDTFGGSAQVHLVKYSYLAENIV